MERDYFHQIKPRRRTVRLVLLAMLWGMAAVYALFHPIWLYSLSNPSGPGTSSSSASLDVDITIPVLFRISDISDLNFGNFTQTGASKITLDDDVCVYTNDSSGEYRITASGNGTASAFTLSKSGDDSALLSYVVKWNAQSGTSGNFDLTAGITYPSNLSGANTSSSSCLTGLSSTGNFQVSISVDDILGSNSGTYTGTLTINISAAV